MPHAQTHAALRELKNDLAALKRQAERLELHLVASLLGMAILELTAALMDDDGSNGHLDS